MFLEIKAQFTHFLHCIVSRNMGRAPCCSKVGVNKGAWSAEEDSRLVEYIQTHGDGNWRSLPNKAGLRRCGKSCRLRWLNYLRPCIKRGNITPDEEELIIRMHALLGNRWSIIAGRVPGRTDNEIKNYWNTKLSRKLASIGIDPKTHKFITVDGSNRAGDRFNQFRGEKQDCCSQRSVSNVVKAGQSTELVIPNVHNLKAHIKVQYTEYIESCSRSLPVESSNECCKYTPADSAEYASLISTSDSAEANLNSRDLHDNGCHWNEKQDEFAEYDVFKFFDVRNAENEICCNDDDWVDEEDADQFVKKKQAPLQLGQGNKQIDKQDKGNMESSCLNSHDFSHHASSVPVISWEAPFWY